MTDIVQLGLPLTTKAPLLVITVISGDIKYQQFGCISNAQLDNERHFGLADRRSSIKAVALCSIFSENELFAFLNFLATRRVSFSFFERTRDAVRWLRGKVYVGN